MQQNHAELTNLNWYVSNHLEGSPFVPSAQIYTLNRRGMLRVCTVVVYETAR